MDPVVRIGGYSFVKSSKTLAGTGSFAEVYKAEQSSTGAVVAIKIVDVARLTKGSDKLRKYLGSEINIMKTLHHEHIVKLLDVFMPSEFQLYMVVEYCAGGDFAKYLAVHKRLSESRAQYYMRQLAQGLKFLRSKNIIHRDLKPQNLLLTSTDDDAVLKISDFGFARFIEPQSVADTLCGSPLYMAPEILKLQKYSIKTDLWSVGAILFETLAGQPLFPVKSQYELIKLVDQKKKFELPSNVSVSRECLSLLESLLQQDPLKRMSWEEFFVHPWLNLRGSIPDPLSLDNFPTKSLSTSDPAQVNLLAASFASLPQPKKLSSDMPSAKSARSRSYSLNVIPEQSLPRGLGYGVGSPPNPGTYQFTANQGTITQPFHATSPPNNVPQKYRTPSYTELPVPNLSMSGTGQSGIPIPKDTITPYSASLPNQFNPFNAISPPTGNPLRPESYHPSSHYTSFGRESLDKDYVVIGPTANASNEASDESVPVSEILRRTKRATAVAYLADTKAENDNPNEAVALYIKAINIVQGAIQYARRANITDSEMSNILYKLRDQFRDFLRKIESIKVQYRVAESIFFLSPEKIIYDQALQMGREGGVCELLKNFEKSEEMYSTGLALIEQLFFDATEEADKEILNNCILAFLDVPNHNSADIRAFQKRLFAITNQFSLRR